LTWPIPSTYWTPGIFTYPTLHSVARGGLGVFHALTGVLENFDAPFHNRYLLLVAALTPVIPLFAMARWRHGGSHWASLPQVWAAGAFVLAILPGPFLAEAPARYFLPAATQLAIIAGLEWRRWQTRAWMAASALGLLTLGGLPWARPRLNEADELVALVGFLERERVEGVYSTSPLLQWQIMYYSHDGIPTRWRHPSDRIPAYPRAVDEALWLGRTTALVGEVADGRALRALPGAVVPTPRYFVLLRPGVNLLAAAGFALNPPSREPR
jgi:hypothetical protein